MKRKQITAILMSAIMTVSACMPMSMPTLAAENAGASETAAAATVEAEPETTGEAVDPEPAPEITPEVPTGEEPGAEPQGTEPEDPAPVENGEDNKEVSGDAATTAAEDEESAIGATEGSTSVESEAAAEDPNAVENTAEDNKINEDSEEEKSNKPAKIASAHDTDFNEAVDIHVGDSSTVSVTLEEPYYIYRFIPDRTGLYAFYSESSADTYVVLYNGNGDYLQDDDQSGDESNFRLEKNLKAGETYYFVTSEYFKEQATYTVHLELLEETKFEILGDLNETVSVTPGEAAYCVVEVENYTSDPVTYEWHHNDQIVDETSNSYTFTPNANDALYCVVSCGGIEQRKDFEVKLNHFYPSESYTQQETAEFGDTVIMWANVYADEPESLQYEWYHLVDGEDETIDGANESSYTINNITQTERYSCYVWDDYGNWVTIRYVYELENNFKAYVITDPDEIDKEQTSATIYFYSGDEVVLRAGAEADSGDITYKWIFDQAVLLEGVDETAYTVTEPNDWDEYLCVVRDQYGSEKTLSYRLYREEKPEHYLNVYAISNEYVYFYPGDTSRLEVGVDTDDEESITYQWYRNDTMISNAKSSYYNLSGTAKSGIYRCDVSDGEATDCVEFEVYRENYLDVNPKGYESDILLAHKGDRASLEVIADANDTTNLKYAWYCIDGNTNESVLISGATTSKYTTPAINTRTEYRCEVTDRYDNTRSVYFYVGIQNHLYAYYEGGRRYDTYKSIKVRPGQGCTLKVVAEADDMSQLQYEWEGFEDNHTDTLVIDQVERSTDYRCYVKDQYGNSDEVSFYVTVENNLKLTFKADGEKVKNGEVYVPYGGSVTLTAEVSADVTDGVTYSWSSWDEDINESSQSIVIDNVTRRFEVECSIRDSFYNNESEYITIYVDNQFDAYPEGFEGSSSGYYFGKPGEKINLNLVVEALDEEGLITSWEDYNWDYIDVPDNTRTITAEFGETERHYECYVCDKYSNYTYVTFNLLPQSAFTAYAENTEPDANGEYPETVDLYPSPGEKLDLHVIAVADSDTVTYNWEQAVNYVTSWGEFESDYDAINAHGESISVVAQKSTAYRCYAEDGKGGEKLITFRIHVSELSAYPEGASIMTDGTYNNRTSVNVEVNVPTTLTVNTNAAVGANLTYKWTMGPLNDSGWWPLEQGADSTTNTLTVTPAQSARYLCTVTDQYDNQALCYFYVNVDGLTFTTNHGTPTLVGDNLYEIHVPATIGEETTLTTQAGRSSTDDISYEWTILDNDGHDYYGGNTNSVTIVGGEARYAECKVTYANGNKAEIHYYINTDNQLTISPVGAEEGQNSVTINAANGDIVPLAVNVSAVDTDSLYYEWSDPEGRRISYSASYNLKVTESGTYKCIVEDRYGNLATAYFIINNGTTSIGKAQIKLSGYSFNYTGKAITPTATVTWNGQTLAAGTDYTISYQDNVGAGTAAAVIVKGTGKTLTGTRKVTFTINKIAQKPTIKIGKVIGGKTSLITISGAYGTLTATSADKKIATLSVSGSKVKITGVKAGKTKITIKASGDRNHFASSNITANVIVYPGAPAKFQAASAAKGLKLTWTKVPGATHYTLYRNGKKLKTVGNVATFTDTAANTNGTKYTYKIEAYTSKIGKSPIYKQIAYFKLNKPAITSLKNNASKKMTINWGKNAKAAGYQIQYALKSNFSDAKSVAVTKNSIVTKTISKLTKGKTYLVRIRSYRKAGSTYCYSMWSAVKKIKITK